MPEIRPTPSWEVVDPDLPVLRAEYHFGSGAYATSMAVGLGDGLLLLSPPGGRQADALFDALAPYGPVTHIVAPNGFHRLGLPGAVARSPGARLFAPARVASRIRSVLPDGPDPLPIEALELPSYLSLEEPPGTARPDVVARVESGSGRIWYLNDLILNLDQLPPGWIQGRLFGLMGFRQGLAVNRMGWRFIIRVKQPCQDWLLARLAESPPDILIAGHGPVLRDPAILATLPALVRAGA